MQLDVQFRKNTLFINKKPLNFDFEVGNAFVCDNSNIVFLLMIPYDNNETLQNIYCLNKDCQFMWQVQSVKDAFSSLSDELPFEGMSLNDNGNISAYDFYGRSFEIDTLNGHILDYSIVR